MRLPGPTLLEWLARALVRSGERRAGGPRRLREEALGTCGPRTCAAPGPGGGGGGRELKARRALRRPGEEAGRRALPALLRVRPSAGFAQQL